MSDGWDDTGIGVNRCEDSQGWPSMSDKQPEADIEDELYQIATVLTTEIRNELSFKQGKAMLYAKLLYAYNKGKGTVD